MRWGSGKEDRFLPYTGTRSNGPPHAHLDGHTHIHIHRLSCPHIPLHTHTHGCLHMYPDTPDCPLGYSCTLGHIWTFTLGYLRLRLTGSLVQLSPFLQYLEVSLEQTV